MRLLPGYRALLSEPGVLGFVLPGLLGRLPMGMVALGTVLLVQAKTGSYAVAGFVSMIGRLAGAVSGPVLAAGMDRRGQAAVLVPTAAVHVGAVATLVVAVGSGPAPTWLLASALVGVSFPPIGSAVRARWAAALAGRPRLATAFALESVLDEVVFVVGPLLVIALAVAVSPAAGLAASAACTLVGGGLLAAQRRSEPRRQRRDGGGSRGNGANRRSGLVRAAPASRALPVVFLTVGAVFSALDVSVVAFTRERGRPGAAGVVLALFAGGSMLTGLVVGARRPGPDVARSFRLALLGFAAGMTLPLAAPSVPGLALTATAAGCFVSPLLILGYRLVERDAPPGRTTESLQWATAALTVGFALGAPAAGRTIDAGSARAGFAVMAGAAATAALTGWLARRHIG